MGNHFHSGGAGAWLLGIRFQLDCPSISVSNDDMVSATVWKRDGVGFDRSQSRVRTKPAHPGSAVRRHRDVKNRNHHKRDDSVWQEDRQRHRGQRHAQNLALTRNALLAIISQKISQKIYCQGRPDR